jgi:hypothetical protein
VTERGPSWFVGLLLLLAAGPLLAPGLPAGPASLLDPSDAATGAAALTLLMLLFVWPPRLGTRTPGRAAAGAAEILLTGLPFVVALALVGGTRAGTVLVVAAILAGVGAVTAVWLAGPGRERRGDRYYAAGALLVLVALPFANYAVNEFGIAAGSAGYRISPLLAVRNLLRGGPVADAAPCLLALLAAIGALAGYRTLRGGTAAALLLLLAGQVAAAPTATPLLGERYVPGRPVWLLLTGAGADPVVFGEAGEEIVGRPAEGGTVAYVPGSGSLTRVAIRTGEGKAWLPVALEECRPGRLLVSLGACPPAILAAAKERGFVVARAMAGAERLPPETLLAADGVVDAGRRLTDSAAARLVAAGLPVVREAGDLPVRPNLPGAVRRLWEEPGRILTGDGLGGLFPVGRTRDPARARTAFLLAALFAIVATAIRRFARGRAGMRLALLGLLSVATGAALFAALRPLPDVREVRFETAEGGRVTVLRRFTTGARPGTFTGSAEGAPLLLTAGGPGAVFRAQPGAGGGARVRATLGPHQTVIVVSEALLDAPAPSRPPDLLFGPDGLARPGEAFRPAGPFLLSNFRRSPGRSTAVRKLLRLAAPPPSVYRVWFESRGLFVRPAK